MQYVKMFEQFIGGVSNQDLQDFVDKFDLTDKDGYDKGLRNSIEGIIDSFKKGNTPEEIQAEFPDLEKIMADAHRFYNDEMIKLALPQGNLQSSNPELPTVNINWGKE